MKIVCIGDSLTYGYGVYRNQCWVTLLSKAFAIDIVNKGVNGDTSAGVLLRLYEDVVTEKPTHVIVMIGTNDILMSYSVNQLQNNVMLILEEILERNIIPVLAIQPPVLGDMAIRLWDSYIEYEMVYKDLMTYRQWAKNYAKDKGITVIDFYENFKKREDIFNLYLDGIHPNAEGQKWMVDCATVPLGRFAWHNAIKTVHLYA